MSDPWGSLRAALHQLGLEPAEQRAALAGMCVPDELALDLGQARRSLEQFRSTGRVVLPADSWRQLCELDDLLDAGSEDGMWADEALDDHPVWARARVLSRSLLAALPPPS